MGSTNNPLNTTNKYYPPTNSAQRGNFTGAMQRAPDYVDDVDSIISGQTPNHAPKREKPIAQYKNAPASTGFLKV